MKKVIYTLLFLGIYSSLVGCGSASGGASGPSDTPPETATNTTTTTTTTIPSVACPLNSTNETATTLSDCTSKPGFYDCSSGECKDVGAGYYSLGGDNTRTQCPAGSYSTGLNNTACVACDGGTYQSIAGQTSCGACTNTTTGASSVVYDNSQTGLVANTCTITDVTCDQYYTKSGVSCVANTVAAPSGATRTPAASITTNSSTVTATVDANTTNLTLYSDSNCTAQIGTGTAAQAASGIAITGLTDQTTNIYGKATNSVSGQESACTSLTTFKYWPSDTFTATYTNTNPLVACDGTQNVTQNLTSCVGDNTGISDNSRCATTSSVSMQSPAGTKNVAITNGTRHDGTRHDTCALGSSVVSSSTGTCNNSYDTFYNNQCSAIITGFSLGAGYAFAFYGSRVKVAGQDQSSFGSLGNGVNGSTYTSPTTISLFSNRVTKIDTGYYFSCATDGTAVKCWGRNNYGQLGIGDINNTATPTAVDLSMGGSIVDIAVGSEFACATNGTVLKCWGRNNSYQLGDGSGNDQHSPVTINTGLSSITKIAAGFQHACATDGSVIKCWGANNVGQLGTGNNTNYTTASSAVSVNHEMGGVTLLSASGQRTCASYNSTVKCWGLNDGVGAIGNGTTTATYTSPQAVINLNEMGNITILATAETHSCVTDGATVKCWGRNDVGQVDGTSPTDRTSPVTVSTSFSSITALSVGKYNGYYSCAASGTSSKCWGSNLFGQFGNGGTAGTNAVISAGF